MSVYRYWENICNSDISIIVTVPTFTDLENCYFFRSLSFTQVHASVAIFFVRLLVFMKIAIKATLNFHFSFHHWSLLIEQDYQPEHPLQKATQCTGAAWTQTKTEVHFLMAIRKLDYLFSPLCTSPRALGRRSEGVVWSLGGVQFSAWESLLISNEEDANIGRVFFRPTVQIDVPVFRN